MPKMQEQDYRLSVSPMRFFPAEKEGSENKRRLSGLIPLMIYEFIFGLVERFRR